MATFKIRRIVEVYRDFIVEADNEDEAFNTAPFFSVSDVTDADKANSSGRTEAFDVDGELIDEWD